MKLVDEILKGLLPEDEEKTVAIYAGGFKPPTKGHFQVIKQALEEHPDIDELLIYIGKKERGGITQAQSLLVWEIYANYLPLKVELIPTSTPPIKAVYNYAKNNPETNVLWIIGAREGDEEDFGDIASRTKAINNYPNIALAVTVTTTGASGTAARNAANISIEKLTPLLPSVISDKEAVEVYNIITNNLNENLNEGPQFGVLYHFTQYLSDVLDDNILRGPISLTRSLDSYAAEWLGDQPYFILDKDKLRTKYKIRPFKDTSDNPDYEEISQYDEMEEVIDTDIINLSKYIIKVVLPYSDEEWEDVLKEKGIPYEIGKPLNEAIIGDKIECDNCDWSWKIKDGGDDLYICHKCDHDNTPKYSPGWKRLNENASYSKDINFKKKIVQLTKHMLDKGMNIKPLPKVRFVDGDSENARDFFGKTAYYSPDEQLIVLYTEGRHPKDIVRSFAHEMIHHIQYLEDRLGNISSTNTTEDDHLDKLEQEANLRGTMTFRNWTDSLNEEYEINAPEAENAEASFLDEDQPKVKDPFGLNAYARELATLREDDMEYKIFSDMDGVITDFDESFKKASDGIAPRDYEKKFGINKFWELIDSKGVGFWVGMPYMSDGEQYWNYIKDYDVELLSSPSRSESSRLGKRLWVRNNMPGVKLTLAYSADKQKYAAPNHILIDDRKSNIDQWVSRGGVGILHTSTADTIRQLKKLGL
jgi:hypothetical protein